MRENNIILKPYPNEHAARIIDPKKIKAGTWGSKKIDTGIRIIIGKLKTTGKSVTQAYRFHIDHFTVAQAKVWLKKHNIKYILFEPATGKKKEFLVECPSCKKIFDMLSEPESHMGAVKCPECNTEVTQANEFNKKESVKKDIEVSTFHGEYKINGMDFDKVIIINHHSREFIEKEIMAYCKKYIVVDYQYATSTQIIGNRVERFYSVIIFYSKKQETIKPDSPEPDNNVVEETENEN